MAFEGPGTSRDEVAVVMMVEGQGTRLASSAPKMVFQYRSAWRRIAIPDPGGADLEEAEARQDHRSPVRFISFKQNTNLIQTIQVE